MFSRVKRRWCDLRQGCPGNRFQAQFERRQRAGKSLLRCWTTVFVAAISLIVGIILCFLPGPGIPFIILGAALLAEQFRPVASVLDRLEIKLRTITWRANEWWNSPRARPATRQLPL